MIKNKILSCSLLQFTAIATYFFIFPFLVTYLSSIGYSKTMSGIIMASLSLSLMIGQPLVGYLSDKFFNIKTIVIFNAIVSIFLVLLIPIAAINFYFLLLLTLFLGAFSWAMINYVDCWCMKMTAKYNINYGFSRSIGSIGAGITSMTLGFLFSKIGMSFTFWGYAISSLIFIIIAIMSEGIPCIKKENQKSNHNFISDIFLLLKNKEYVLLLICSTLTFIFVNGSTSFLINLIEAKNGDVQILGNATAIGAFSEVPAMILFVKIAHKIPVKKILSVVFVLYILRVSLPVFAPNPNFIVLVFLLQSVTYAIFLPAIMYYVQELSPKNLHGTAITLTIACYSGLGNILGNIFGGIISDNFGIYSLYYVSGIACAISAFIFIFFHYLKSKKQNKFT